MPGASRRHAGPVTRPRSHLQRACQTHTWRLRAREQGRGGAEGPGALRRGTGPGGREGFLQRSRGPEDRKPPPRGAPAPQSPRSLGLHASPSATNAPGHLSGCHPHGPQTPPRGCPGAQHPLCPCEPASPPGPPAAGPRAPVTCLAKPEPRGQPARAPGRHTSPASACWPWPLLGGCLGMCSPACCPRALPGPSPPAPPAPSPSQAGGGQNRSQRLPRPRKPMGISAARPGPGPPCRASTDRGRMLELAASGWGGWEGGGHLLPPHRRGACPRGEGV